MKKVLSVLFVCFLLSSSAAIAEEAERHFAVDIWGFSHHVNRQRDYNEFNPGGGVRLYYGNLFAAVDIVDRNSVRGNTWAFGVGYEYPLAKIGSFTLSPMIEIARMGYQFPKYGTLYGPILLPRVSIRKGLLSGNVVYVPSTGKRSGIVLFFATVHFERETESGTLPFAFCRKMVSDC